MTLRMSTLTDHLAKLGGDKWRVHFRARALMATGRDVIEMTIGEPDVPTPQALIDIADQAMRNGRTRYSNGRGEPELLAALAARYAATTGLAFSPDRFLCFPGAQTALYAVLLGIAEPGDEVLVGDPMYATYEGVIRASGANMVSVPLRPEHRFHLQADDLADYITPRSRVVFLNNPHNPSGAVLSAAELEDIGALADRHDLWLLLDEVYEELVFDGVMFTSPLMRADLASRVITVSSISKSHAAPGFRSGWCAGPALFIDRLLPLAEMMLFGNQPFIADMTAHALSEPSPVAQGMRRRFAARASRLGARLHGESSLRVHQPEAGMFALIDISSTGLSSEAYAFDLLENQGVAVMPGSSFGPSIDQWVRVALTIDDGAFDEACRRIVDHAREAAAARSAPGPR